MQDMYMQKHLHMSKDVAHSLLWNKQEFTLMFSSSVRMPMWLNSLLWTFHSCQANIWSHHARCLTLIIIIIKNLLPLVPLPWSVVRQRQRERRRWFAVLQQRTVKVNFVFFFSLFKCCLYIAERIPQTCYLNLVILRKLILLQHNFSLFPSRISKYVSMQGLSGFLRDSKYNVGNKDCCEDWTFDLTDLTEYL